MQYWEYKSIKVNTKGFSGGILESEEFDAELNRLGLSGWELVSTFVTDMGSAPPEKPSLFLSGLWSEGRATNAKKRANAQFAS